MPGLRYRFGVFEADAATGELWRQGLRVRVHAQSMQVLLLMLETPGELVTREAICTRLWPAGTFVDYEHSVNSAVNRLREALGDSARNPRFLETLARKGYRFLAPVEKIGTEQAEVQKEPSLSSSTQRQDQTAGLLATESELPQGMHGVARPLFLLLQGMYLGFYAGSLANLPEIQDLLLALPHAEVWYVALVLTASLLIPVRAFLLMGALFRAPAMRGKVMTLWPFLLPLDLAWSLAPFLLLHHIAFGVALACTALLVYSPFAQRSLVLMGAVDRVVED